jgi:hypothetical protein
MRWPVVVFLSFLTVLCAVGCRKPLTPNVDRNLPPETWITAAPQDTITEFGPDGPVHLQPGTIAVRFHVYWAGADTDGEVAGFYYAVVETLPQAPVPPLPGPKPRDYRYTTRTDSTFVFRVTEVARDRQHAFYIYAVDNQGKADATPARVIFNALDQFPPVPVIEFNGGATATGFIYRMVGGQVVATNTVVFINDSLRAGAAASPRDTVPVGARLDFRWRGEPTLAGTYVTGYRYKLDEARFNVVDASVQAASYNTGVGGDVVQPGTKIFTLRALDDAGGARETNRYFYMNYMPDTWFSGPDTTLYPKSDPSNPLLSERSLAVNWASMPPMPASLLSCDSITLLPAARPARKSFFEIYRDRLYVHSENDTVRLNSWVLVHGGGSDKDSPYNIQVILNDPRIPDTTRCDLPARVIRPGPPNGSPVGFHQQYTTAVDPTGDPSTPSQSGLFPIYNPASAFREPEIGGYQAMLQSGKIYAVLRSEDGNGLQDRKIIDSREAQGIADRVDAGLGSPEDIALRSRILTYYVNKAPKLLTKTGGFIPREPWPYTFSTRQLGLNLLADDEDPYDPNSRPGIGGPSSSIPLRWAVRVKGRNAAGEPVVHPAVATPAFSAQVTIDLPNDMVSTSDTLLVQLCDCASCELSPGQGRCVNYRIPINVPPPPQALTAPASIQGPTRPGASNEVKRSFTP